MDIETIRLFIRIAQGNTLSSVAEDANLSQSSLSKSIIRLENELDVQLLDRTHRNVTLTPAGKAGTQGPVFQSQYLCCCHARSTYV